jgi:hypothetical protein
MALPDREHDPVSAGSILRELVVNQYQAILLVGAALVSLVALNPLPLLLWVGAQLVLLPLLDSGPLRRWVWRRRRERAQAEALDRRKRVVGSFVPEYGRRYAAMESLCGQIEANYQGLHGISQAYLAEQRDKLDQILDGCVHRMTALQRYDRTLAERPPDRIEKEIARLEQELGHNDLNERARAAIRENLELKRRLLTSHRDARGTMKALSTELDSMASLLEVLHQSSISMRDPEAIAGELDAIVRQSESSGRAVREMEALLREGAGEWSAGLTDADVAPAEERPAGPGRRREGRR